MLQVKLTKSGSHCNIVSHSQDRCRTRLQLEELHEACSADSGYTKKGRQESCPIFHLLTIALWCKVFAMESNWATEQLQVIRTLMERSAVYRRALAPIMTFCGVVGIVGGVVGWWMNIDSDRGFVFFWSGAAVVALLGSLLLVRRQALKDAEPFWTPPTRRVAAAIAPPLLFGVSVALLFLGAIGGHGQAPFLLPPVWMALYGCALHAAGFFMPRGIRRLSWLFLASGSVLLLTLVGADKPVLGDEERAGHLAMGTAFGALHLACGIYLYFTEKRGNET